MEHKRRNDEMKASEFAAGGSFLKAEDLKGKARKLVVAGARSDIFHNPEGDRKVLILQFEKTDRELVLNKTNTTRLIDIFKTDETDDWVGQEITVQPERVDYKGSLVEAIRVRMPEPEVAEDFDDDIPW